MADFLLYLAIFFAPMGAKVFSFPIAGVKMSLFRLLTIISIVLLVGNCLRNNRRLVVSRNSCKYSTQFVYFWFIYATVTGLWAKDPYNWFRNLFFLLIAVFCVVLFINRYDTHEKLVKAFWALHWGIAIQAVIGWYELITHDYRFIDWTDQLYQYYLHGRLRAPVAMAGNQNDFATMMMFGIFISYICFSNTTKKWLKTLCIVIMFGETALILLSTSRANMIGFALAIIFLLIIGGRKKLLILPAAFLLILVFPETINNLSINMYLNLNSQSSGDSNRLNLIRNGFVFLWRTLGFGVGCGQIESWMATEAVYPTNGIVNMHNWWMEILTGYGVLVFIGYIVFYFKMLLSNIKIWLYERARESKSIAIGISLIMISYTVASISSSSNFTREYLWVFWALCIVHQSISCGVNSLSGGYKWRKPPLK